MSNVQIPNLPVGIAVNGTEQIEAVQSGVSVRLTTAQIASYTTSLASGVSSFRSTLAGISPTAAATGIVTLSGTLGIASGGTGQTSASTAFNALSPITTAGDLILGTGTNAAGRLGIGTSGQVLTSNGTTASWSTVAGTGTVTSVSVSGGTTGLTTSGSPITGSGTITLSGTLGIASGGTGQTSASTAFNALSPITTAGDLILGTGTNAAGRLGIGTNGQVLTSNGTTASWSAPATSGTVTSVSISGGTTGLTTSGNPITGSGTITLSGTLAVANGGTGVTASTGANSVVLRDASANATVNAFFEGFTSVAAAGTTTNLTAASAPNYVVTGSGGQTFQFPDATTLPAGAVYSFNNNQSSGTVIVKNNSGTTLVTLQSGAFVDVTLLVNSSAAGSWDTHNQAPSNASWSTNTLSWAGSITNSTWNGVVVGGLYGGTGVNNGASTITYGGSVTFSGAYTFGATLTANTSVTFPTSGTLATTTNLASYLPLVGGTLTGALLANSAGAGNVARVAGAAASSAVVIGVDSTSADTNVNITIGNPKGTGYISAQTADSTATGGNARGSSAVDWLTVRSAATQVASGAGSVIGGGQSNTASASQATVGGGNLNTASGVTSTVAGGDSNTASGQNSWIPGGSSASVHGLYGAGVGASGTITTNGDAQWGKYIIRGRSVTGNSVRLTADNLTAASTNTANIPLNTAWMGTLGVVAREVNTGNCCYWHIRFGLGVQGSAGSTTYAEGTVEFQNIIGSTPVVTNLTRTADTSNRGLNLTFAPPVSSAIAVSGSSSTITGTAMVLNSVVSGTVAIGQSVSGTGVTAGTYITAGSGLNWTVSPSQTVTATTFSMYSTWDLAATIRTTEVQ